jgi:hypothetical protein
MQLLSPDLQQTFFEKVPKHQQKNMDKLLEWLDDHYRVMCQVNELTAHTKKLLMPTGQVQVTASAAGQPSTGAFTFHTRSANPPAQISQGSLQQAPQAPQGASVCL